MVEAKSIKTTNSALGGKNSISIAITSTRHSARSIPLPGATVLPVLQERIEQTGYYNLNPIEGIHKETIRA